MKVGQRCVGRCVEGPRAVLAAIALHPTSNSVLGAFDTVAVWKARSCHRRINGTQRMGVLVQAVCHRPQVRQLLGAETG